MRIGYFMQGKKAAAAAVVAAVALGLTAPAAAPAVLPVRAEGLSDGSIVDTSHQEYTYDEMVQDLILLQQTYPGLVTTGLTVQTAQGRSIPLAVLGNMEAPHRIMVTASIHAREYITTPLVMKMIEEYAQRAASGQYYGSISYQDLLNETCFVIVPMANPDGVAIAQFGVDGATQQVTRHWVSLYGSKINQLKANSNGVDINRNFPTGWADAEQHESGISYSPSLEFYKGPSPCSEAESQNLVYVASALPSCMVINYHTQGNVIYYSSSATNEDNYQANLALVNLAQAVTGYQPYNSRLSTANGTWADYYIETYQKPSITIEVGTENPVPVSQFPAIWNNNKDLWGVLLYAIHIGAFG